MLPALVAISCICVIALALCVWYIAQCQALRSERDRLMAQLTQLQTQSDAARGECGRLETELAVAQETQAQVQKNFDQVQARAREVFQALAGDVLKESNQQFLQLAQASLKTEQAQGDKQLELRKKEIEGLVAPIKEKLDRYAESLKAVEGARQESYGVIRTQIGLMAADQQKLRTETSNLVRALHRSDVRGRWGEVQLRRVAELAGMIENCDFYTQQTQQTSNSGGAGGVLRPDMVVRLPGERSIVVDAKTPIDAYLSSLDCTDEPQRAALLERHAQQVDSKAKELSSKEYWAQFERAPEFTVLFIPGESFLYAAAAVRPDLIEKAMEKGVVIATPTTLIALLKTVALAWREEKIAENAQRISDLGRELHERLWVAVDHVQKMGGALETAVDHYNRFVGSFESRVVVSARKLEEMGAGSARPLPPEIKVVETVPRQLKPAAPGA